MNIKDVARLSGVSISTISRVINNSAKVRPDVKERIEKVLAETGYRPNSLAKELQLRKTNSIGVLLPRIDLGTFAAILDGVTDVLHENGYHLLLANTHDREEEELRYLSLFHGKRVDGVLYFATKLTERHAQEIGRMRMPVIVVGQSGKVVGCPAVRLDNFGAARALVSYLIEQGHRRIGCLAVPDHDENIGTLRLEGYRAALADHGIAVDESLVAIGDFEYPSGEAGAERLMGLNPAPTALYCITDRLAVAASGWLMRRGFAVPGEVSVACLDDPALLSFTHPRITTMSFDYRAAGTEAGRLLIDAIEGRTPPVEDVVLPFTLRVRDSTSKGGSQ